jgi:pyruvoyl-dependent arginine decarboxylase (PvlArgDC)
LSAYREGRPDEIKYVVSTSSVIPHLDHMVIRLAKQLPSGKVTAIVDETGHNELDEDDLR